MDYLYASTEARGNDEALYEIEQSNTIESNEEPISLELIPCPTCSRTFVRKALEKHIGICEKMAVRKRKIFDSSRQRREGTELASYPLPKNYGLPAAKLERGLSPKPAQVAPFIHSPKKPPEGSFSLTTDYKTVTPKSSKKLISPSRATAPLLGTPTSASKESRSKVGSVTKRIQPPPAEPCPYCDRCFGVKAYDRHVEWCKEKALIASIKQQNTNSQAAAKERLEARIKYRAPCLKTKRSVNRDKYSYQNDENFDMQNSMDDNQKSLMTSSMTSSFMSDSVVSDRYDPFVSAKRQLEELCSPSSPTEGNISPSHSVASSKTTNTPVNRTSNKMTNSFTSRGSLTNPRAVVSTPKSNFHRTSSLRAPRRSPLPTSSRHIFFPSSQKQRPTIQRGLSDEGPISSNFLKPEEFDEIPVRSVCVNDFAISNTPRVIRRDSNAAPNRNALALNLQNSLQKSRKYSPTPSNSNLLKTDSLAIFLKHENEAKESDSGVVNTKELKDKSNALSKQNSAKSVISADERNFFSSKSDISQTNLKPNSVRLEPIERPVIGDSQTTKLLQEVDYERTTRPGIKLNSLFDRNLDRDYIDPKLINACDNLPIELSNDFASNSSSSPPYIKNDHYDAKKQGVYEETSQCTSPELNTRTQQHDVEKVCLLDSLPHSSSVTKSCPNSNRSSGDNRIQLKRKIRVGRNQFLYDASPEAIDNDADDEVTNRSSEQNTQNSRNQTSFFPMLTHPTTDTTVLPPFSPSTFNEFDFEEFLSAFDKDDEHLPSLFKDCREFLTNRSSLNKRSNVDNMTSYRSPKELFDKSGQKYEQDVELNLDSVVSKNRGEIFISIETDQSDNDPQSTIDPLVAANPSAQVEEVKFNDKKFQKIEDSEAGDEVSNCIEDEENESQLRMRRIKLMNNDFPNVSVKNAKNLNYPMEEEFLNLKAHPRADVEENSDCQSSRQTTTENSVQAADSDEIRSSDFFSVHKSDNGAAGAEGVGIIQSKQSSDSAYGSLSRQSPTVDSIRSYRSNYSNRMKQSSATQDSSKADSSIFQYPASTSHKYSTSNKNRCRNLSLGSSSSSSDNSLPPINTNKNLSSELLQTEKHLNFNRNPLSTSSFEKKNNPSKTSANCLSKSSSAKHVKPLPTTPSSSVKASKFCHECGSKFLLDQAKFCMDCGVRRIVLK